MPGVPAAVTDSTIGTGFGTFAAGFGEGFDEEACQGRVGGGRRVEVGVDRLGGGGGVGKGGGCEEAGEKGEEGEEEGVQVVGVGIELDLGVR